MTPPLKHHFIVTIIGDLIADEIARMRPTESEQWKRRQWSKSDRLIPKNQHSLNASETDVAVDSLERLALAGRVVQFFQMENSGVEEYLLR